MRWLKKLRQHNLNQFQVDPDYAEDYDEEYEDDYEGEDYDEGGYDGGEYEDDYEGEYEGDYEEEYEGDYDGQENEGGDEDYYDYDYEEKKSEDAVDEGSEDYDEDYEYDGEDAVGEEKVEHKEEEIETKKNEESGRTHEEASGTEDKGETVSTTETLPDLTVGSSTEKTDDLNQSEEEEERAAATIDVDEVDDVIEDYYEAAYDELAEDGSGLDIENSFGSEESESDIGGFTDPNQSEDKEQIITDDEDMIDGSGEEM